MPFVIMIVGIFLLVAGARGKGAQAGTLIINDAKGFMPWVVSIAAIGAVGYIKPFKPIADAFLILIIVVLFLTNGAFFTKLFGASTATTSSISAGNTSGAIASQSLGATLPALPSLGNSL